MNRTIENKLYNYKQYLQDEEKSAATVNKYVRDVSFFSEMVQKSKNN